MGGAIDFFFFCFFFSFSPFAPTEKLRPDGAPTTARLSKAHKPYITFFVILLSPLSFPLVPPPPPPPPRHLKQTSSIPHNIHEAQNV
jgi:hypothetical protein